MDEVHIVQGIPNEAPMAFEDEDVAKAYSSSWDTARVLSLTPCSREVALRDRLVEPEQLNDQTEQGGHA